MEVSIVYNKRSGQVAYAESPYDLLEAADELLSMSFRDLLLLEEEDSEDRHSPSVPLANLLRRRSLQQVQPGMGIQLEDNEDSQMSSLVKRLLGSPRRASSTSSKTQSAVNGSAKSGTGNGVSNGSTNGALHSPSGLNSPSPIKRSSTSTAQAPPSSESTVCNNFMICNQIPEHWRVAIVPRSVAHCPLCPRAAASAEHHRAIYFISTAPAQKGLLGTKPIYRCSNFSCLTFSNGLGMACSTCKEGTIAANACVLRADGSVQPVGWPGEGFQASPDTLRFHRSLPLMTTSATSGSMLLSCDTSPVKDLVSVDIPVFRCSCEGGYLTNLPASPCPKCDKPRFFICTLFSVSSSSLSTTVQWRPLGIRRLAVDQAQRPRPPMPGGSSIVTDALEVHIQPSTQHAMELMKRRGISSLEDAGTLRVPIGKRELTRIACQGLMETDEVLTAAFREVLKEGMKFVK